jgi:GntR family transcriptional repressor for pyruvate dehydrogenase complex
MFRKAKQSRIFQDVIGQIQEAILQGKLQVGDRLPSERVLREMFEASRGTLREALRVLEEKGLIYIKRGVKGGAVVKEVTTQQISENLDMLMQYEKVSLRHLSEFREGAEGIVAGLAAKKAGKKDVQYLKSLLTEAEAHLKEGPSHWGEFLHVDSMFHMAIARIAGNPIYESVLKTVHDNIHRYYDRFPLKGRNFMRENYRDLCSIVKAVENGQPHKAHLLAHNHVKRFNRFVEETVGSSIKNISGERNRSNL